METREQISMQRTTLLIPDRLHDRLRQIAAEQGGSMATVVREALEERVARAHPVRRSLGIAASAPPYAPPLAALARSEPQAWR